MNFLHQGFQKITIQYGRHRYLIAWASSGSGSLYSICLDAATHSDTRCLNDSQSVSYLTHDNQYIINSLVAAKVLHPWKYSVNSFSAAHSSKLPLIPQFHLRYPHASYSYHVAAGKLVNLPTKTAASSVERCWWTVCGRKYIANKSYRSKTN